MSEYKNFDIKETFDLATKNHQENNLDVAEKLYNKIIKIDPNHLDSLNNLALLLVSKNNEQEAIPYLEKIIKIKPDFVRALTNLSFIFEKLGNFKKAINYCEKVIAIDPNYADAHYNLAIISGKNFNYYEAMAGFIKVIEIQPRHISAYNNLGGVYRELAEPQKAIDCFKKAIEINPNYAMAHYNLGSLNKSIGELDKAINNYKKAIDLNSKDEKAYNNIGVIYHELGDYQKAIRYLEKSIEINPNYSSPHIELGGIYNQMNDFQKAIGYIEKAIKIDPNSVNAHMNISGLYTRELDDFEKALRYSYKSLELKQKSSTFINERSVSLFRLKHDVQQAKYLSSKNYNVEGIDEFQKVGDEILNREENNSEKMISLKSNEVNSLLPFYKATHIYEPKSISVSCLNPNKNWLEVEEQYLNSSNQIMYIDDFLSEEALVELREFCLVSKVWHREYKNKYLGAFSNVGFISPIHLQIATDLKQKLPKLFGPHKLGQFWGFKYDSTLGKGINIHADFAFHNLNFWVTPDEYNNNKNSGGLKVYDAPAPDHWTFSDYNTNQDKIYKFLEDNNAKCTNVTYKCNRAVLFNSAYFHETDEIDFKDEYEGRRINNTYLFGNRLVNPKK